MSKLNKATTDNLLLLVGDNAFQGVNHLSQNRARDRTNDITNPEYCADLVIMSLKNGADGFMFSINQNMLSVLREIRKKRSGDLHLHAIVPSAVDYIRVSGQKGMEGLTKDFTKQMITSGNLTAVFASLVGASRGDINSLLRGLLSLEIGEIKAAAGKKTCIDSVLLHELLTDMGLALDLKWFFESFIHVIESHKLQVGFETRNSSLLIRKFREWQIDLSSVLIVAPFNEVGFQMSPSKETCESDLKGLPTANVIVINVLASGYYKPFEAVDYIHTLPNVKGVAIGISKEAHAKETFRCFKNYNPLNT